MLFAVAVHHCALLLLVVICHCKKLKPDATKEKYKPETKNLSWRHNKPAYVPIHLKGKQFSYIRKTKRY